MSLMEVKAAHKVFKDKMEFKAPKEERPTPGQLTALRHMVTVCFIMYVDLAIWGPFHNRLRRKLAMQGLIPTGVGQFRRIEIRGPPDFDTWLSAFLVLKTALIMLGLVGPTILDEYVKKGPQATSRLRVCHMAPVISGRRSHAQRRVLRHVSRT